MKIYKEDSELILPKERDARLKRPWLISVLWVTFPLWSIVLLYLGMKYFGTDVVKVASEALLFVGAVGFLASGIPILIIQDIPLLLRLILVVSYYFFTGFLMIFLYFWPLAG